VAERTALLEQANNELEAFSYSVSHDLRSPLRAINGFAHLLAEHAAPVLDDQGRDMLERIQRGSTRMGQLIDDILHFSRMARVDMTCSDIELDAVTRSVATPNCSNSIRRPASPLRRSAVPVAISPCSGR
jgi:light-regulated signal transduction histidine kinase (bacteriophytochrome)